RKSPSNTYHNLCISYFPDGEQMISGSEDQTVRRWDLQAGKEIEGAREVCEQGVHAVGVSGDGRWVVAAGGDDKECGELKVWEVETGIIRILEGHSQSITCVDISADSTLLASGVGFSMPRIWSLDTGKLVFEIQSSCSAGAVRFSRDSKKLAVNSNPKTVYELDASTLEIVGAPFEGHSKMIHSLALSFDCAILASASQDSTIKLWAFESRQ
ncbi:WD40 repeat-like protein, partial [Suillus weaverae]